jgi:hypothetical protein
LENPSPQQLAAYSDAATPLERDHAYEVTAVGRRFRITPVYRLIRMNGSQPGPPGHQTSTPTSLARPSRLNLRQPARNR